jgi:DNA-binding NtrC family response regulator
MPRVLVVDDEDQIRGLLQNILVRAGHEVHTANSVQAAIEMCGPPAPFDVVVTDVVMPGMDGHELARWLADRCPNMRVILMSGFDPGCEECPYADNCHRLPKPFAPQDLAALVSEVLAQPIRPRRPQKG